jgi:hypothetical protein
VKKYLIAVLFFLLNSSTLFAQRHGCGDAIQVFAESNHNSHLLLQIKNNESRLYVCTSDPKKNASLLRNLDGPDHGVHTNMKVLPLNLWPLAKS